MDPALFWLKFKKACRRGNVKFFLQAIEQFAGAPDAWDIAMQLIAELPQINSDIRHAFLNQWSKHKQLSYRAHQDPVVERGLRALLPKSNYVGPAIKLFRGTTAAECRQYGCGVSWTKCPEIAHFYCRRSSGPDDGVVLTAVAPPDAVLQQREYQHGSKYADEVMRQYGREDEYVVDPSKLLDKRVIHREEAVIYGVIVPTDRPPDPPRVSDPIIAAIAAHSAAADQYFEARNLLQATIASGRPADEAAHDLSGVELWTQFSALIMREAEKVLNGIEPTTAVGMSRLRSYLPDRFAKSACGKVF